MIPQSLQTKLRSGEVIPFIGAGVSRAVVGRDGQPLFPNWRELLLHAADRLAGEGKEPASRVVAGLLDDEPPDYLEAAKRARGSLGALWPQFLQGAIDRRFSDTEPASLELARAVWQLGNLLITTNYDMVLQWACPDTLSKDLDFWDIEAKVEQGLLIRSGRPAKPTIWHLHGRIGNAAELILTPDGYKRLYGGETERLYHAALRTFQTLVASRSLLFIGFSLDDEALGVQFRAMNELFAGVPGPHYALIHERDVSRLRSLNLPVEPVPFSDFGEPLIALVRELGEIAKQGHASLVAGTSVFTTPAPAGASYSTDNRPFFVPFRAKGDRVIGAEEALQRVRDQLTRGRNTSIGQTASFEGLGGLGKTQLAVEYAWRYGDDYPNGVIWLTADQDISAQLTRLAVEARWVAPESDHNVKLEVAQRRLRSYSGCLIVFDNVEDVASIEPYLPAPSAQPHLLATSRTEQPGFVAVPLGFLEERNSLILLASEAGRIPIGEEEEAAAKDIVSYLGGLPLALEMAGAYLLIRPVRWEQYRDLLRANIREALRSRHLSSFTRHEDDLFATLRVQEGLFDVEPHLREILHVLTWSGSAMMGLSLLAAILKVEPTELLGALSLGVKLRLIESSPQLSRFGLHRLVRKVRQEDQSLSNVSAWAEEVCRRLGDWFFALRQDFADLAIFEAEIDHLQKWRENAEFVNSSQASRLTWLLAYPPFHWGQYAESRRWIEQAISRFQREGNSDGELNAWLWDDLGTLLDREGNLKEALELQERALSLRLELLGEEHPDTAFSLLNVGIGHGRLEDLNAALAYSSRSLVILRKILGEEHRVTARSLANLGGLYGALDNFEDAFKHFNEALSIQRRVLGEEHPETTHSLAGIGSLYIGRGELDKALQYYRQVLDIRRRVLGEEHPDTVTAIDRVRRVYVESGELVEALKYARQAFEVRQKVQGASNAATVASVINLAKVLLLLDRRQEAFRLVVPYLQASPASPEQASEIREIAKKLKAKPFRRGFRQPSTHGKRKAPKKRR